MKRWWAAGALLATGAAFAQPPVMLVLDASGSMWGQIGGRTKVEIARDAVGRLVGPWNPDVPLGLVAYGHRQKGDCGDIETLVAPGPLDPAGYLGTVRGLNAKGMTPLSAAVIEAAKVLRSTEQKATVILVSDGEETCNLDPCQVGRDLEAAGVDFTAHVIGFDVPNPQHQAQLRCLAETTGGRYFNARSADELAGTLSTLAKVSSEPPLPPASAVLQAPDTVPAASRVDVAIVEGPLDHGDYIALVDPAQPTIELTYAMPTSDQRRVDLTLPSKAGRYELHYVSPRRAEPVLGKRPIVASEVEGAIDAPATAEAGSMLLVRARGPVSEHHWIGFAPTGSASDAFLDYARPTGPDSEVRLRVPTEPGRYELRYVLNEHERVLVSRPIEVTTAGASVRGPAEAAGGDVIEIDVQAPAGNGNWVGFAPAGSNADAYLDYRDLEDGQQHYSLDVPIEPGDYELRVVMTDPSTVLASQPIRITAPKASISAPAHAAAGSQVTIRARGPIATGSWAGFAPAGSPDDAYLDFRYIEPGVEEYTLTAPDEAGDYELRYIARETAVVARQPIRID